MLIYYFSGTLTDVNGEMNWFMPGLAKDSFFSGTMVLKSDPHNPKVNIADLSILASDQLVKAHSFGLDPMKSFADHVPIGPFSSPTVQHGYIDNTFFKLALDGASLGSTGFTIQGPGPHGTPAAGAVIGSILSISVIQHT